MSTDSITFKFPDELTLPSPLICSGITLITTVTCTLTSTNTVKVTFTQVSTGVIAANTEFAFNIANIDNPSSTKPTTAFSGVVMNDANGV